MIFLFCLFIGYTIICFISTDVIIEGKWSEFLSKDSDDTFLNMNWKQKLLLFFASPIILF